MKFVTWYPLTTLFSRYSAVISAFPSSKVRPVCMFIFGWMGFFGDIWWSATTASSSEAPHWVAERKPVHGVVGSVVVGADVVEVGARVVVVGAWVVVVVVVVVVLQGGFAKMYRKFSGSKWEKWHKMTKIDLFKPKMT